MNIMLNENWTLEERINAVIDAVREKYQYPEDKAVELENELLNAMDNAAMDVDPHTAKQNALKAFCASYLPA